MQRQDPLDAHDLLFSMTNNGLYMTSDDMKRALKIDSLEIWYTDESIVDLISYDDGRKVSTTFKVPGIRCTRGSRTFQGQMPLVKVLREFDVEPKSFRESSAKRPEFGKTSIDRAQKANRVLRALARQYSISVGRGTCPFVDWMATVDEWAKIVDRAFSDSDDDMIVSSSFPDPVGPMQ